MTGATDSLWETVRPMAGAATTKQSKLSGGFIAIIVFKFLKALAFGLLGVGALRLAHLPKNSLQMVLVRKLGVSGDSILVRDVSNVIDTLTKGQVQAIGAAAIFIALVFAAEGTFLILRKPWAPLFTIVLTALGIPPEILEIVKRPHSARRYVLLAINASILYYLWRKKDEFRHAPKEAAEHRPQRGRATG
jgi:uncharacterized membrane protein (DUF2068 family)